MGYEAMRYGVLGPIEVRRDGRHVDVVGSRQRALLALLLIHANRVVSTDRIIDEIWGDDEGLDRQSNVWVLVSRLRRILEPDRPQRSDGTILVTRPPGYVLEIAGLATDAASFEGLAREGQALLETDPAAASLVIDEALALWRGDAYEEFTYQPFAAAEIDRLEELRLVAHEDRIDADLKIGRCRHVVADVENLVRLHPFRQRLVGHQMLALHLSGRQSDALRAMCSFRNRLTDEVGLEPSTWLLELERQIVDDAPALHARPASSNLRSRASTIDSSRGGVEDLPRRLLGRALEASVVEDALRSAIAGRGRSITLIGHAGIGKSRLVAEVVRSGASEARTLLVTSAPVDADVPYSAVLDLISQWHGWHADIAIEHRRDDLMAILHDEETAGTLAQLFATGGSVESSGGSLDERRVIDATSSWLLAAADGRPVVIVIEDLQWVDATSLTALDAWVSVIERSPVMIAMSARPEFVPPWVGAPSHTLLRLGPLDLRDARELIAQRLPIERRDDALVDELADRSDGVPLFAEELVSAAIESDDRFAVPMTLRQLLDDRMQRLGAGQRIAQIASVLGRSFDADMLRTVGELSESETDEWLRALVGHEIVLRTSGDGERYEFRHSLVQEAAYESLSTHDRRSVHRAAATALTEGREMRSADAATIAFHWDAAGESARAAGAWEAAGLDAQRRAANHAAARFFALALQAHDAAGRPTADDEVRLLIGRIEAISMGVGWAAADMEPLLDRVRARSTECTDRALVFETLIRLHFTTIVGGRVNTALRLVDDARQHAIECGDDAALARADMNMTSVLMNAGHLGAALDHASAAIEATDADGQPLLSTMDAHQVRGFAALVSTLVADDPEREREVWMQPVVDAPDPDADPVTAMFAQMSLMIVRDQQRAHEQAIDHATALFQAAEAFDIPTFHAMAKCYRGQARAWLGDRDGLAEQLDGLDAIVSQGMLLGQINWWTERAELLLEFGEVEAARDAIDHAGSGEWAFEQRLYVPKFWRVQAKVARAEGRNGADVVGCYQAAIDIAEQCGMVNWLAAVRDELVATRALD